MLFCAGRAFTLIDCYFSLKTLFLLLCSLSSSMKTGIIQKKWTIASSLLLYWRGCLFAICLSDSMRKDPVIDLR